MRNKRTQHSLWAPSWSSSWRKVLTMLGQPSDPTRTSFCPIEMLQWEHVRTNASTCTPSRGWSLPSHSAGMTMGRSTCKSISTSKRSRMVIWTGFYLANSSHSQDHWTWPTDMVRSHQKTTFQSSKRWMLGSSLGWISHNMRRTNLLKVVSNI